MEKRIVILHNIPEKDGRTRKEKNLELPHTIPIGALVELYTGERLYVCDQTRDCDGTPLYAVCMRRDLEKYGTPEVDCDWDGLGRPEGFELDADPIDAVDAALLKKNFQDMRTRMYSSYEHGYSHGSLKRIK
jgi:hypothetical protein